MISINSLPIELWQNIIQKVAINPTYYDTLQIQQYDNLSSLRFSCKVFYALSVDYTNSFPIFADIADNQLVKITNKTDTRAIINKRHFLSSFIYATGLSNSYKSLASKNKELPILPSTSHKISIGNTINKFNMAVDLYKNLNMHIRNIRNILSFLKMPVNEHIGIIKSFDNDLKRLFESDISTFTDLSLSKGGLKLLQLYKNTEQIKDLTALKLLNYSDLGAYLLEHYTDRLNELSSIEIHSLIRLINKPYGEKFVKDNADTLLFLSSEHILFFKKLFSYQSGENVANKYYPLIQKANNQNFLFLILLLENGNVKTSLDEMNLLPTKGFKLIENFLPNLLNISRSNKNIIFDLLENDELNDKQLQQQVMNLF